MAWIFETFYKSNNFGNCYNVDMLRHSIDNHLFIIIIIPVG